MPIHRRKWWIRQINEISERQKQDQEKVVRMPQPNKGQAQSLRARDVGR